MKVELFLTLLTFYSALTTLCVEAEKKLLENKKYPSNALALTTAVIIGTCGTLVYYYMNGIPFATGGILYAILLGLASGLASMVGYDKVQQLFTQMVAK